MIFNNINNIPAVTGFETLYGSQLCRVYPELDNLDIRIYTDQQGDGRIKEGNYDKDSPYTSNHLFEEIMRCEDAYNKCNFTMEEEYAILAHELGHIVAGKRGEKSEISLQEEMNADQKAASLGLASHMQAAIQKMMDANLKPSNNAEMQQRIDALRIPTFAHYTNHEQIEMDKKIGYKWQFIGSLIVVSLIAIISYACLAHSYHQRLDRIEEIQIADGKQLSNLFNITPYNKRALAVEADKISRALEDHEKRMESLMELEFEKLQNDFNFISLWAGIITIVFLIFSIYSIFKTDEMLKKSETVYEQIKRKSEVIENLTKNIQSQYQSKLGLLKKESDDYMKEMAQKMTMLNERLANADTFIKDYREVAQTDEVVQTSTEEQDVQEKNETT